MPLVPQTHQRLTNVLQNGTADQEPAVSSKRAAPQQQVEATKEVTPPGDAGKHRRLMPATGEHTMGADLYLKSIYDPLLPAGTRPRRTCQTAMLTHATCAAMPLTRKQPVAHALKDAFSGRAYMPNGAAVPIKIMANNGKGRLDEYREEQRD
jgi:hypothetical protein